MPVLTVLRAMRLRAELSQAEFAEKVGVAQPMFSNWELGLSIPDDRAAEILTVLVEALGPSNLTADDLTRPYHVEPRS